MDGPFDEDTPAGPARIRDGKDSVTVAVAARAEAMGIRLLRGGGTVFARHGLISPRVAPFTAFIVDPARVGELGAALESDGWEPIPTALLGQLLPPAIRSYERAESEGRLNLHGIIPGFFADPATVFDVMWAHREEVHLRGVPVLILDKPSTVLLAAHNRLGGQNAARAHDAHFDYFLTQFRDVLDEADRAALLVRASEFGGDCEIRPLLVGLGLEPHPPVEPSAGYVRMRLAVDSVTAGDTWLITRLERSAGRGAPFPGLFAAARSVLRLVGARSRAAR